MKIPKKPKKSLNKYARFSGMAFQMLIIILIGTFVGVKLDQIFPNQHSLGTVFISLFSVILATYFIIKQIIDFTKKNEK